MIVGGLLFPPSYGRDQYTPAEEARMEAEQARAERMAPPPGFTEAQYEEAERMGRLLNDLDVEGAP